MNTSNNSARDRGLKRDQTGRLVFMDEQGHPHETVQAVRGFPISDPDHWISICDQDGRELLAVKDPSDLSAPVREVLEQDLARREFVPVILRIINLPANTEPTEWEVETDRGVTQFLLNSGEDVRRLGTHRALIIDSHAVRYLINDIRELDISSRRVLDRYL